MTTLETERRIFAEIQEHKMAYNVRQKIKPAYDILKHEAVGAVPFTSDIYRFLLEGIAAALGVNLDAEYEQPEPEAPAPAPVLIPTGSPSGQMNFSQPGHLQPQGAEVANSGTQTQNVMAGRQPVPTDLETVYAPGLGNVLYGVNGQTTTGAPPTLDSAELATLVARLEEIMRAVGKTKPAEAQALAEHRDAKPLAEPDEKQTPVIHTPVVKSDEKPNADKVNANASKQR